MKRDPNGLTTHVLDVVDGCPAEGVAVAARRVDAGASGDQPIEAITDRDGRADLGAAVPGATYEIAFSVGAYTAARGRRAPVVDIAIRVVAPSAADLHVPLLIAPGSAVVYLGS